MTRSRKFIAAVELTTERFVMRPVRPFTFARRTFLWTKERQAMADLTWRVDGWSIYRWWRHLRRLTRKNRMCHGIWPKECAEPIGLHVVSYDPKTGNASIGVFVADRAWWGKGVVLEVRPAILDDCFKRLGMHRATGWVNARNFASIYNYQRLGFRREAALRESVVLLDGARADQFGFGTLRSEWLSRQSGAAPSNQIG
ncbi:MAG: GNAT family N-acetyltransferase [Pseudaminobacter sp.]|nr:GNAT family N-acetyltransferase [Pseudaminobacter sp.]